MYSRVLITGSLECAHCVSLVLFLFPLLLCYRSGGEERAAVAARAGGGVASGGGVRIRLERSDEGRQPKNTFEKNVLQKEYYYLQ